MDKTGNIRWRDITQKPINRGRLLPSVSVFLLVPEQSPPSARGTDIRRRIILIDGIDLS
jgi:hypothetical protein